MQVSLQRWLERRHQRVKPEVKLVSSEEERRGDIALHDAALARARQLRGAFEHMHAAAAAQATGLDDPHVEAPALLGPDSMPLCASRLRHACRASCRGGAQPARRAQSCDLGAWSSVRRSRLLGRTRQQHTAASPAATRSNAASNAARSRGSAKVVGMHRNMRDRRAGNFAAWRCRCAFSRSLRVRCLRRGVDSVGCSRLARSSQRETCQTRQEYMGCASRQKATTSAKPVLHDEWLSTCIRESDSCAATSAASTTARSAGLARTTADSRGAAGACRWRVAADRRRRHRRAVACKADRARGVASPARAGNATPGRLPRGARRRCPRETSGTLNDAGQALQRCKGRAHQAPTESVPRASCRPPGWVCPTLRLTAAGWNAGRAPACRVLRSRPPCCSDESKSCARRRCTLCVRSPSALLKFS